MNDSQTIDGESTQDLKQIEKKLSSRLEPRRRIIRFSLGMGLILCAFFLPYTVNVQGYEVLFYTADAQAKNIMPVERIYVYLTLIAGLLLPLGVIISRHAVLGWVNWVLGGIGTWYFVLAVWMRHTRPQDNFGDGPGMAIYVSGVGIILVFLALSSILFSKTAQQEEIARVRRAEADRDEEARARQQVLRTGIQPREHYEIPDERRLRSQRRREKENKR